MCCIYEGGLREKVYKKMFDKWPQLKTNFLYLMVFENVMNAMVFWFY